MDKEKINQHIEYIKMFTKSMYLENVTLSHNDLMVMMTIMNEIKKEINKNDTII
jgi:hypothetical protein